MMEPMSFIEVRGTERNQRSGLFISGGEIGQKKPVVGAHIVIVPARRRTKTTINQ
jgi:hypothetical protein